MKHRPWPLIVLTAVFVLLPVLNMIGGAIVLNQNMIRYIPSYLSRVSALELVFTWGIPWLAALSVYTSKKWTYISFYFLMGWLFYSNIHVWRMVPGQYKLWFFILTNGLNLAVIYYFAMPTVRLIFINQRVRWWEALRRYPTKIMVSFSAEGILGSGEIQNISKGGMLFVSAAELKPDARIEMSFSVQNRKLTIPSRVVYCRSQSGEKNYGIQFLERSWETKLMLDDLILDLKKSGVLPRGYEDENRLADFKTWVVTLLTTGKGLVPEVPASVQSAVQGGTNKYPPVTRDV